MDMQRAEEFAGGTRNLADVTDGEALAGLCIRECDDETTVQHLDRHRRILDTLVMRYGLDEDVRDLIEDRWPVGFDEYGEYNHHAPQFTPLLEALFETCDSIDLCGIHALERVELGIADPLRTPEQRDLYDDALRYAVLSANALSRLIRAVENDGSTDD